MKNYDSGASKEVFAEYENIKIFFITAIFLVIGLNLISSYFSNYFVGSKENSTKLIIIGLLLCVPSVAYFTNGLVNKCKKNRSYEAFIIYDIQKNELIPIPRYEFSQRIWDYLNSAFLEDPALKDIWDKNPLEAIDLESEHLESNKSNNKKYTASQLLKDSVECYLLYKLSMCLTNYSDDEKFSREKIELFNRENLSDIVLSNKLLELISKPMEERPCFKDEIIEGEPTQIVSCYSNGFQYEEFSLFLPIGSKVTKLKDKGVEIKSKNLDVFMSVQFEGYNILLPEGFLENYLGRNERLHCINVYEIGINIKIKIKLRLLFSRKAWKDYHTWIDLYIEELEKDISKDVFFNLIGWETAYTLIQYISSNKSSPNN